ncbi:MAG TPA: winged helix-turn-helix domain-containing protein [Methanomassiliicoccales archaeon]|nr:winged helix-turn-helix domain-containing protein [Methanomassiliicoccales archaeon]
MSDADLSSDRGPLLPRGSPMRVELDKKALFALASDTRLEILKSLNPMRRTVTQLSQSLGIDKAAVYRHLKKLEEGEFVKRYEDHGFVYYGLTWKARDLLDPKENTKIVILISSAWVLLLGAVIIFAFASITHNGDMGSVTGEDFDGAIDSSMGSILLILGGVVLAGAGLYLVGRTLRSMRKPKQAPLSGENESEVN